MNITLDCSNVDDYALRKACSLELNYYGESDMINGPAKSAVNTPADHFTTILTGGMGMPPHPSDASPRRQPIRPGDRFGRLVILDIVLDRKSRVYRCLCRCDCGIEGRFQLSNIRRGATRSCGCYRREVTAARDTVHAMFGTPTYRAWTNMRRRCRDTSSVSWPSYGARGITVCPEWESSFRAFFEDMGLRPEGTTLDRRDVNKNYCKENCRWASRLVQARNKTNNRYMECDGERLTITEWASRLGCDASTIHMRIKLGWTTERAVKTPVRGRAGA